MKKNFKIKLIIICMILLSVSGKAQQVDFVRLSTKAIISPDLLPHDEGANINGPSLIKTPDWLPNSLGKYYLYFAHHGGDKIRLAYSDSLSSGWKVYEKGTLKLTECSLCKDHIASPDVFVDHSRKEIILYFHAPVETGNLSKQYTFRAVSKDGVNFTVAPTILGDSYFRVFEWKGKHYAIARVGELYRSVDGGHTFENGPNPFREIQTKDNYLRHAAVKVEGDKLYIFYSRIGDNPESIVLSTINLTEDWKSWKASTPVLVAKPELAYGGATEPLEPSGIGAIYRPVNQLRDPAFYEENNKWYLLYSVAGENGIGIGQVKIR